MQISQEEWEKSPQIIQELVVALSEQLNVAVEELASLRRAVGSIAKLARQRARTPQQVVFVCDQPTTRQFRLAYALRSIGWEVILLSKEEPWFDAQKVFSEFHRYQQPSEALVMAATWTPTAFHVFGSWHFETPQHFIANKLGPTVFDTYDMLNGGLQPEFVEKMQQELQRERFCIENADALCCRSLSTQNLKHSGEYKVPKHKIFFPEYCMAKEKRSLPKRTDGLHLVYVGSVNHHIPHTKDGFGCDDFQFIESITETGSHYHIYPSCPLESFHAHFDAYREYAAKNPLFHLHAPVPLNQLLEEISQYHFGIITCGQSMPFGKHPTYTEQAHRYHLANKVFDYLDANLGVVIYAGKMMDWIVARTGAGIVAAREQLPAIVPQLAALKDDPHFFEKVALARERYSMERQAPRLAAFYQHFLDSKAI